jgi:hypothetical protein
MEKLKIDRRPLHFQTCRHLLGLIENGDYERDDQLPSEADVAAQLGISRPTLREALLNLFRITWKNQLLDHGGDFGGVNCIELPPALTAVQATAQASSTSPARPTPWRSNRRSSSRR